MAKKGKRGSIAAIAMDPQLMRAMTHPTRIKIVAEINKPGRLLSPRSFSDQEDVALSSASYHFRALEKFGCIEIAEERPVRGATEHIYKASRRMLFDSEEWAALPEIVKAGTAARALSDYLKTAREAIEAGTFEARDDSHLSWTTARVDDRGWCKASKVMADALEQLLAIEAECAPRLAAGAEPVDATFGLGLFESPRVDLENEDNAEWGVDERPGR